MVEADSDALAVTARIRSETRAAKERARTERALSAESGGLAALPPPVPSAAPALSETRAAVAVPAPAPVSRPADADAAFRRARLGVVAAIALVLLLAWVMQRRRGSAR